MTQAQKRLLLNLSLSFGVLAGLVLSMFLFIQPSDLKDYTRLTDGAGTTVRAVAEGGVGSSQSGRRGASVRYCTSWKYEIDGNERHFTDKSDCHVNQADAQRGAEAELIYDPSDLGIIFVHSDQTRSRLETAQKAMRIASVVGVVVLVGSVVGLVVTNRKRNAR